MQNHQGGSIVPAVQQAYQLWWKGLVVSRYECAISSGMADAWRLWRILFWYKVFKLGQLSGKMCEGCTAVHPV